MQNKMTMEEALERIKNYIECEIAEFTPIDQYLICEELVGWIEAKSSDALKSEYMTNNMEDDEDE